MTAERAREEGFCKRVAESPAEVANLYQISGQSSLDDPTLGHVVRPVWIKIDGPLEASKVSYLGRRIEQARQERVNLIFFEIDSPGGLVESRRRSRRLDRQHRGYENRSLHQRPRLRAFLPFCPWLAATSFSSRTAA